MDEVEARLSILNKELDRVKKERSSEKARHQNEILKLRREHAAKIDELHNNMANLSRKKKQQQSDMKVYREIIIEVFSDTYLPAFCVAKQAFLLRAVHTMMCFDQALFLLSKQCAEEMKEFDRTIHRMQDETANVSQELLSQLILVERHLRQCEEGMVESQNRMIMMSKLPLHPASGDAFLDDVPLEDESQNEQTSIRSLNPSPRSTPKPGASSERTLDTLSLSYADMSSVDGEHYRDYHDMLQKQFSIPKFVNQPTLD